jgi:hypothetical protein
MTTDNFLFYFQNRLIQTSQTGGQWYSDTSPLVFPALGLSTPNLLVLFVRIISGLYYKRVTIVIDAPSVVSK